MEKAKANRDARLAQQAAAEEQPDFVEAEAADGAQQEQPDEFDVAQMDF